MTRPDVSGLALLAFRALAALGRIGRDRLGEVAGRALPRTAEQLARPRVVDDLLREYAPSGAAPLPPVRGVRLPGVDFESSNCTNFLIEVDFEVEPESASADELAAPTEPTRPLPRTLYAKLPCPELATRAFANAVGFWEVEACFCERVAPRLPIRVPEVRAVARRGARFVLLLENLHEVQGVRLFLNRDMAAGTDPERARMCLSSFAELHAAFWGWSREAREALLPERLHPYLAPGGRALTRALNAAAIAPAHRAAPEIFTRRHADLCRLAIEKWDALVDTWYAEPLTLIHGDSHLANCFEYPSASVPRMGMLDFQGVQWCQGIRVVQYFLSDSLETDVLAAHENGLIDFYLAELARRGVDLDAAEAREQYRALSFQTLMVAVVSLGLGSLTERDDTVRTVLRRSVASIDRLGFGEWLESL